MCQVRDEFIKWYQEVVTEPIEAFRKHTATCPDCQEWLLSQRDALGLDILSISDEDLKKRMSEGKGLRREVKPAKRVRNMINGLEEIETEYRAKYKKVFEARGSDDNYTTIYLDELKRAKQALERLWKDSVG